MDTDQLADADFARACELSSDLRELVEKESCTQGKLMDALLLKRNDVVALPPRRALHRPTPVGARKGSVHCGAQRRELRRDARVVGRLLRPEDELAGHFKLFLGRGAGRADGESF